MRVAILSDIHSNLAAFEAVLRDAGSVDALWCLGDVVGYGPDPNECLDLLQSLPHYCVAGNHDWGAVGKVNLEDFNEDARRACEWTSRQLTLDHRRYLEALSLRLELGHFTLVHGSPRNPIWEYLVYPSQARENLAHLQTPHGLVGHTHMPAIFSCSTEDDGQPCQAFRPVTGLKVDLKETKGRLILNPGSVGQPRDGNAQVAYALLDMEVETIEFRRVPYDVHRTQAKMRRLGLPEPLAARLSVGR
ncbi:MAG: metallophosphoesterase family protein [Chloroflexi bacterium]|nr:metallophosphoesterase family protein [Chloroflexota bacterium]